MAATTQVTVTKSWTQLSNGDCTLQAVYTGDFYHIAISDTAPTNNASITIKLDGPVNFTYNTAVWCKLAGNSDRDSAPINVIK